MSLEKNISDYVNIDSIIDNLKKEAQRQYLAAITQMIGYVKILHDVWEESLETTREQINLRFDNTTSQNLVEGFILKTLPLWPHEIEPLEFLSAEKVQIQLKNVDGVMIIFEFAGGHYTFHLPSQVLSDLDSAKTLTEQKVIFQQYVQDVVTQSIEYSHAMGL